MKKNKSKIKKKNKSRKTKRKIDKQLVLKKSNLSKNISHSKIPTKNLNYTSSSNESILSTFERIKKTIENDRMLSGR